MKHITKKEWNAHQYSSLVQGEPHILTRENGRTYLVPVVIDENTPNDCQATQGTTNKLYYLHGYTDHEMHDTFCCCGVQNALPHRAIGARLYVLDVPGLQALNDRLHEKDFDCIGDWLNAQESQGTFYGFDEDAAIREALLKVRNHGWLVLNHPETFPWSAPLLGALRGVVGNSEPEDGYLGDDVCECDNTHKQNSTICRVCYARLICHVLYAYLSTARV